MCIVLNLLQINITFWNGMWTELGKIIYIKHELSIRLHNFWRASDQTGLKLKSQSKCLDIVIAKLIRNIKSIMLKNDQSSHYFPIIEKLGHFSSRHCHYWLLISRTLVLFGETDSVGHCRPEEREDRFTKEWNIISATNLWSDIHAPNLTEQWIQGSWKVVLK